MPKRERARLLVFYRLRSEVRAFGAQAHILEPIGCDLEQWLAMPADHKKLKLEFARTAAKNRK